MENWSNRIHRSRTQLKKRREGPQEPKQYFFEGYVEVFENFVRARRRIVVIETQGGDRSEVFVEQLD